MHASPKQARDGTLYVLLDVNGRPEFQRLNLRGQIDVSYGTTGYALAPAEHAAVSSWAINSIGEIVFIQRTYIPGTEYSQGDILTKYFLWLPLSCQYTQLP